jgi:hypothetical protein
MVLYDFIGIIWDNLMGKEYEKSVRNHQVCFLGMRECHPHIWVSASASNQVWDKFEGILMDFMEILRCELM